MTNFSTLALCPVLKTNLTRNGYHEPTPVQAQAIPPALEGRDVVATAQTGTGKTLAFLLPLLASLRSDTASKGINAVVLCPTRELAIQIEESFRKISAGTGIKAAVVVGGMNESRQLQAIRAGAQVLIATPGRLCDYLNRKLVKLGGVRTIVLDEADRMLDMGFLPPLKIILSHIPENRQTLFFSATIEKSVAHLVNEHTNNPVRVTIGVSTRPAEHVDLHLYEVEQDLKLSLLSKLITTEQGSFLVFARTKHGADKLAKKLSTAGFKTTRIHGDRTQSQRNEALRGFKEGYYRILVATDVAARGIHVEGIAHVVNYDLPQIPEDFIHRVGRTGRAGARGVASTFSTRNERSDIRRIERAINLRLVQRETGSDLIAEKREPHSKLVTMPPRENSFRPKSDGFAPKAEGFRAAGDSFRPRSEGGFRSKSGSSFKPKSNSFSAKRSSFSAKAKRQKIG